MLAVLSPAKTLDFDSAPAFSTHTQPLFRQHSAELVACAGQLSAQEISELMSVSGKIAELNVQRFKQFDTEAKPGKFVAGQFKQALFAFAGDVYSGLQAETLDKPAYDRARQQLRILSGLYGYLRPSDLMQPYRLEMGTRLANPRGSNLYQFWGDIPTTSLNQEMHKAGHRALLNLASQEYFKVITPANLTLPIVSPEFLDEKNGQYKVISFFAKKARGMMARWMLDNAVTAPDDLRGFSIAGYQYSKQRSSVGKPVFIRSEKQLEANRAA